MFETLGVLIVFMVLIGFSLIFYNVVQQSSIEDQLSEQAERKSLEISEKALLLPELDCSTTGISELNCIDMLKVLGFMNIINKSLDAQVEYFNIFETSTVRIRQIWPPTNNTLTLYDGEPDRWRSATLFASPVLLYYPLQETNTFGMMEVVSYAQ